MILEDCKTKKKNLSTVWIDYKKAFDSVPHTWIIKCMEIYKIGPVTVNFIAESMRCWKTTLHLNHAEGSMTSRPINIKSGIFQGDSLSPLLFCLALAPLSSLLNASTYGYEAQGKTISHLFYMDDLKTYAKSESQQTGLLNISCGYTRLLPKVTLWVIALGRDWFGFPVRFIPPVTLQIITRGQLLTWQCF